MKLLSWIAAPCLALILMGCENPIVYTRAHPVHLHSKVPERNEGVLYYLPMQRIEVTLTRAPVKDAKEVREKAEAALKTADDALKQAKEALKKKEGILKAVNADPKATDKQKDLALEAVEAAKNAVTGAEAGKREAEAAATALIGQWVVPADDGKLPRKLFADKVVIKALSPEPDTTCPLLAQISHDQRRDDQFKMTTTATGLLSSADATLDDRTDDILVEMGRLVGAAVLGFPSPVPAGMEVMIAPPGDIALDNVKVCGVTAKRSVFERYCGRVLGRSMTYKFLFDPSAGADDNVGENAFCRGVDGALSGAGDGSLDGGITGDKRTDMALCVALQYDLETTPLVGKIKDPGDFRSRGRRMRQCPHLARSEGSPSDRAGIEGLVYPRPIPYQFTLRDEFGAPLQSMVHMLPNDGPLSVVPLRSAAFVETKHAVAFENGLLTSYDTTRPSETLAVIGLPLRIVSGVLEAPATIIKLRVDYSSQQEALINAQRAVIEAQEKLDDAQAVPVN
ncbi:MAG: hypothetical protein ACE363_07010 [Alphaproteobacteria bacterium]